MHQIEHEYGFNGRENWSQRIESEFSTVPFIMLSFQDIRIAAINILSSVSAYPAFIILPFSQDVLHGLLPALDDKKRLVRSAAVLTRNQWFLIGSEN